MDLTTINAIAEAAREKQIAGENILRSINALAAIAWRTPVTFYQQLGTQAVVEAGLHRELIEALQAVAPELMARIQWPPFEVIYFTDGHARPTAIPFSMARPTMIVSTDAEADALEAQVLAEIAAQTPTE